MLPYKSLIKIIKNSTQPIYLQIANEIIQQITIGVIKPGTKLAGSRTLAGLLGVNRRTVILAFDELLAQGWVRNEPNRGSFVNEELPTIKPKHLVTHQESGTDVSTPFFPFKKHKEDSQKILGGMRIDDGYPDVRLAPLKELSKNYNYVINSSMANTLMNYRQAFLGDEMLRDQLVKYLGDTRGIHVGTESIMITRGSQMAFYLLFQTLLEQGDKVIVGVPGFNEGYQAIQLAKGQIIPVPVDSAGLDVERVEEICKNESIRALFIISHHHYPTTVSLSAERRMTLLTLAENHQFAIIEDDYDYDYHYASSPILPLASADAQRSVAYVGSFSKIIAPSLRIGFIVAHPQLIQEVMHLSKYIDSFGNTALERALAMLIDDGVVRRHIKKTTKTYLERRESLASRLNELGDDLSFRKPEGGLAFWIRLKAHVSLDQLILAGKKYGLTIPNGKSWSSNAVSENAIRLGFAYMNEKESVEMTDKLAKCFRSL